MRRCFICRHTDGVDFEFAEYPRERFLHGKPICAHCDDRISKKAIKAIIGPTVRRADSYKHFRALVDLVSEHENLFVVADLAEQLKQEALFVMRGGNL